MKKFIKKVILKPGEYSRITQGTPPEPPQPADEPSLQGLKNMLVPASKKARRKKPED